MPYTTLFTDQLVRTATPAPVGPQHTRGEAIIAAYNLANPVPNPFNMTILMNCLHAQLLSDNWSWIPSNGREQHGRQLLEGVGQRNQGQCAVVAGALYLLMIAPPPFGCGQGPGHHDRVESYSHNGQGFVSNHPLGGIFNLPATIHNPVGILQGLYFWDNHYVVRYNNAWYDPCYNVVYNNAISDMSVADLSPEVRHGPPYLDVSNQGIAPLGRPRQYEGLYVCRGVSVKVPNQRQLGFMYYRSGPWPTPYNAANDYGPPQQNPPQTPAGRGPCYITTATCQVLGKGDDCDELTTLRWYRDNVLVKTPEGAKAVDEYYKSAGYAINAITEKPVKEADQIYDEIYKNYILPSVAAVKQKKYTQAQAIFMRGLAEMKKNYPPINMPVIVLSGDKKTDQKTTQMLKSHLEIGMPKTPSRSSTVVAVAASVFPHTTASMTVALSEQPILLNGMKVIFDQPVGVYPVTLESKVREGSNGN